MQAGFKCKCVENPPKKLQTWTTLLHAIDITVYGIVCLVLTVKRDVRNDTNRRNGVNIFEQVQSYAFTCKV